VRGGREPTRVRPGDTLSEGLLGSHLQLVVDSQPEIVAGKRVDLLEHPFRPAGRIDFHGALSIRAPQERVVRGFHAVLADACSRFDLPVLLLIQVGSRDLAHVAEHVGGELVAGIVAKIGLLDADPRKLQTMLFQIRDRRRFGNVLLDGRDQIGIYGGLLQTRSYIGLGHAKHTGKARDHLICSL
jgi:hypothetical protein